MQVFTIRAPVYEGCHRAAQLLFVNMCRNPRRLRSRASFWFCLKRSASDSPCLVADRMTVVQSANSEVECLRISALGGRQGGFMVGLCPC
jgi:hypothetical protein